MYCLLQNVICWKLLKDCYLGFDSWCTTCNSKAIWLTFSRAPDLIQSSKPPSENSYSSISIWRIVIIIIVIILVIQINYILFYIFFVLYLQVINASIFMVIFSNDLRQRFEIFTKSNSCFEILNVLSSSWWSIDCVVIGKYLATF